MKPSDDADAGGARLALTGERLVTAVDRVANLLGRFGKPALSGDPEVFALLRRQRARWAQDFALDVLVTQTRPKAEAAFREGRFREAAELYERIASRLTPTEQKKLAAARKRA